MQCADCPDLTMLELGGRTTRAMCCRDQLIEQRLAGDQREWDNTTLRERMDSDAIAGAQLPEAPPGPNRKRRRAARSKAKSG